MLSMKNLEDPKINKTEAMSSKLLQTGWQVLPCKILQEWMDLTSLLLSLTEEAVTRCCEESGKHVNVTLRPHVNCWRWADFTYLVWFALLYPRAEKWQSSKMYVCKLYSVGYFRIHPFIHVSQLSYPAHGAISLTFYQRKLRLTH